MHTRISGFDWDDGNREKCRKHGVALAEIEELFALSPHVAPDDKHSQAEARFIAVGRGGAGRAMFVAYVLRERDGRTLIRPLSARYMHRKEVKRYEESAKVQV